MGLSGVLVIRGRHRHSIPQKSLCPPPLVLMEDGDQFTLGRRSQLNGVAPTELFQDDPGKPLLLIKLARLDTLASIGKHIFFW